MIRLFDISLCPSCPLWLKILVLLASWRFNYWSSFVSFVSFVVKDFGSLGVLAVHYLFLLFLRVLRVLRGSAFDLIRTYLRLSAVPFLFFLTLFLNHPAEV